MGDGGGFVAVDHKISDGANFGSIGKEILRCREAMEPALLRGVDVDRDAGTAPWLPALGAVVSVPDADIKPSISQGSHAIKESVPSAEQL